MPQWRLPDFLLVRVSPFPSGSNVRIEPDETVLPGVVLEKPHDRSVPTGRVERNRPPRCPRALLTAYQDADRVGPIALLPGPVSTRLLASVNCELARARPRKPPIDPVGQEPS